MSKPRDDLQDFLAGNDPLNELYGRRERAEPPAHLDESILAAAAIHARQPAKPRWLVPISLAATVVLGAGLTVRQLSSPLNTVSEMAVQDAISQSAPTAVTSVGTSVQGSAGIARPSIDDIPRLETEENLAPEPVSVDLDQARRRVLSSTPIPTLKPVLTPPAPRPLIKEAAPASEVEDAPQEDLEMDAIDVAADDSAEMTSRFGQADKSANARDIREFRAGQMPAVRTESADTFAMPQAAAPSQLPGAFEVLADVERLIETDQLEAATERLAAYRVQIEGAEGQDPAPGQKLAQIVLERVRELQDADQSALARSLWQTLADVYPNDPQLEDSPAP